MAQQKRHGFTLIELLVVTIIIGILAALITPAIMAAVRRSKEFTIQSEMKQIEAALEKFKNEYGVYPVDFGNPYVLNDFIRQIAPNQAYGDIVNEADFGDSDFWFAATLSGGRSPQTIDRAEALVIWLGGVSTNGEYPLGVFNAAFNFADDPNYTAKHFFDFDETRLKDLDNDGWFEYYPASGPQNPYVYFDARTLSATNAPDTDVDLVINQAVYPSIHSPELFSGQIKTEPPIPSAGKPIAAYLDARFLPGAPSFPVFLNAIRAQESYELNASNAKFSYQLIAAGLDGEYGAELIDPYDYSSRLTSLELTSASEEPSPSLDNPVFRAHRDNFTNLKGGDRLDIHN